MSDQAVADSPIPRWYWLAYLTGGFGLALNAMMSFLLPLRAVDLGISIGLIGVLLGVKGAVEAMVSVPIGGLIDGWVHDERSSSVLPGRVFSLCCTR